MKIGLFFGSFNPVHIGHLAIANYFTEFSDLQQVWLVVSPQNPFKGENMLISEYDRFHMVETSLAYTEKIQPSKIEFELPKPSYTIDTLEYLSKKYPKHEFVVILGSDNLLNLNKWKNYERLITYYSLYIYPRIDVNPEEFTGKYPIQIFNAPRIEISSSFIRKSIINGHNVRYFMPYKVYDYIIAKQLYTD